MPNRSSYLAGHEFSAALLGLKKDADTGGTTRRVEQLPAPVKVRLSKTIDRLIGLYIVANKPDEVAKWRAERAKYSPSPRRHPDLIESDDS